jgi:signal transduction histidine kinase
LIRTVPPSVIGGLSLAVFGLITATAGRIWVENNVNFTKAGNLMTVGVSLVAGAGDLTLHISGFSLGGIGTASLGAIVLYQLLGDRSETIQPWQARSEIARATSHSMVEEAVASVVHDLRQPVTAIIANANAAMGWLEKSPPDLGKAQAALTRVGSVGQRANDVIESIRSLLNRDTQNMAPVNVNELVLAVLSFLGEELEGRQITARTELMEDIAPVMAERTQLQQVIVNLVMNAIDAMRSITDRPRILRIRSAHEKGNVLVMVEDSGSGIDPNDLERIFKAFFTTKPRGMGMGLAMCRSIVEAHGGRLWAMTGTPHGSAFHLTLPQFDGRSS